MHVLQLLPSLDVGGVERGVLDLSKGLIRRGHRVSVVSSGGSLVEPLARLGAAHHQLPVHEKSLQAIRSCASEVEQLILSTGVELVHARSRVPGWIGFFAARRSQRPFLTTAHGFYRPHWGSRVMVWGRLVIAPSEALGRYLIEQFGLPKDRLRIIPRGVDLETFTFQPAPETHGGPCPPTKGFGGRAWRLGLFGRLSPLKGQPVAVRACHALRRKGIDVRLVLAGDPPESPQRRALEALITSLGMGEAVEWLGIRQDLPALIASMDLALAPSIYPESFGRSVIEAQAVGRPVVASRAGALSELVEDGVSGLLVPPNDPHALAGAIERFIQDGALRARCATEARRRVEERWSLDRMVERTLEVYEECLSRPRVLIWKLGALGDTILATPSLRAIRKTFPQGHLTLAVGHSAYQAVARCPYLNDFIVYEPGGKDRGLRRQAAFVRRLADAGFDVSIDLQNSRRTHLLSWLAGIPVRAGYRRKLGWLCNRGVRLPKVVLAPVAHQFHLLRQALPPQSVAGARDGFAPDGEQLELWPGPIDEQAADRLLQGVARAGGRQLVGVHPGGSGRWQTKRWDLERWAQLCDALGEQNIQIVVTGGPDERALGEALLRLTKVRPLMLVGQTNLMELACVIKRCGAFIAHDSSSLHVAAAVGTPAVALFGPTDPRRHLPPSFNGTVIKKDVFCSPCYSPRCRTVTHACMTRIGVEEVLSAVLALLADADTEVAQRANAPTG
jgi:lipopolysaccharide heptosyltransferase II